MTELLKKMITDYKNNGERVDEVLYQEVMKTVTRALELEKAHKEIKALENSVQKAVEMQEYYLINNDAVEQEIKRLRGALNTIAWNFEATNPQAMIMKDTARQALEGKRDG
ncbi:hypothetical protein [Sporosarcina sp. FSL K6-5500]|uniref:hypothetical protein n=1 Tax=Sporosarcina sp. FSL K6-5500 TaxID=2921558 RepID=UPI0030FD1806